MRKCRPQARDVPLKGSGAKPSLKSPKPSEPLQVALQWKLLQLVVTSANSRLAFFSECLSIRNNLPFEIAFHSKWLRNNPKWPHGPKGANGRLFRMGKHSEKKANLKFAEVITNCNKFCCKATHKGSEGFGPLQGGLSPESPQNDIYLHGFGAKAPFERLQKAIRITFTRNRRRASNRHFRPN